MGAQQVLANHVNYHDSSNYTEVGETGFCDYKNILERHLIGDRGLPTWTLRFGNAEEFQSDQVGLGATASCPLSLRMQIVAQHNHRANESRRLNGKHDVSDEYNRITNLMAATFGMVFSLTYRIVRAVLRTLFAPVTLLYSLYQQCVYGIDGWVVEDLRRICWEWIDVGTTLLSFFSGIINTFHPDAISLDFLRDFYIERTDYAIARNQEFARAKQQYNVNRALTRKAEA